MVRERIGQVLIGKFGYHVGCHVFWVLGKLQGLGKRRKLDAVVVNDVFLEGNLSEIWVKNFRKSNTTARL